MSRVGRIDEKGPPIRVDLVVLNDAPPLLKHRALRSAVRLLDDVRVQLQTEHALQVAIQICIDIAIHIAGERALRPPDDYRGVFATLREAGILEDVLAARLGDTAGLRP